MTPEQEILEDALLAARQRADSFADELLYHATSMPLDALLDWSKPSAEIQTEMAAFTKRYEMTQDLITRRLFRSVLAVRGTAVRTKALADVVGAMTVLGIVPDPRRWDEITKLRNSFAHDYALSFAEVVPLLNQAWQFAPDLIGMVGRVERFVAEHDLLTASADR